MIAESPQYCDVLFPLIEGKALNSTFDGTHARWIIDFHDWPLEKAREFPLCMKVVEEAVLPKRQRSKRKRYREYWWQFGERQQGLYRAALRLPRVIVIAYTSNTLAFTLAPSSGVVYYNCTVVCKASFAHFAILQSSIHLSWVRTWGSTMKGDARYAPERCYESFPFPEHSEQLDEVGETYYGVREDIIRARQRGLTKIYNHVRDESETGEDIVTLRKLQKELDRAVAVSYGWTDLPVQHGFFATPHGIRYTLDPATEQEVLSRLLSLNMEMT